MRDIQIGVIGAGEAGLEQQSLARAVGRELGRRGITLLCGGLGGVMAAAAEGARSSGGLTVGILPGPERGAANPYIRIGVATNMGHARNVVLVHSSDGLIAIGGEFGTLSEIAVALKLGKPVVGLGSWDGVPSMIEAGDPGDAVERLLQALGLPELEAE